MTPAFALTAVTCSRPPDQPPGDGGDLLRLLVGERELFLEDAAVIRIGSGHEYADRMMAHGAEFFLCQSVKGRSRLL